MLTIGIVLLVLSRIRINISPIFSRISLGIILYSLILSYEALTSFGSYSDYELGILGGLFHINNLINGIEIYIYIISLLGLILVMYQVKTVICSEYYIIILFCLLGMILLICSYDLISTFLSIELQSLSLYIITAITKKEAIAAGLKYYLLGSLSSAILLLGLVLIYIITGVTQYDSLFLLL
jgi:NADH-ubiquinone oxidoreductase chain 2